MRRKVEAIAERLTKAISSWAGVECVISCEQAEVDILDPYFALALDVYHRAPVPAAEERRLAFGDPGAFESARLQPKDRFFLEELPVRIEYKRIEAVEEVLDRGSEIFWLLQNSGTYMFYRLETGKILFSRGGWIEGIKERLGNLPDSLWEGLREGFQTKMEHYLADLGAALFRDDPFFYIVSLSGFMRYALAAIFMANRRFEPSHRSVEAHFPRLDRVPDDFAGRWDILLREDGGVSAEQKHKVAELLARSIFAL